MNSPTEPLNFEQVATTGYSIANMISRAPVPGGWLLQFYVTTSFNGGPAASMLFIPDPLHDWQVKVCE